MQENSKEYYYNAQFHETNKCSREMDTHEGHARDHKFKTLKRKVKTLIYMDTHAITSLIYGHARNTFIAKNTAMNDNSCIKSKSSKNNKIDELDKTALACFIVGIVDQLSTDDPESFPWDLEVREDPTCQTTSITGCSPLATLKIGIYPHKCYASAFLHGIGNTDEVIAATSSKALSGLLETLSSTNQENHTSTSTSNTPDMTDRAKQAEEILRGTMSTEQCENYIQNLMAEGLTSVTAVKEAPTNSNTPQKKSQMEAHLLTAFRTGPNGEIQPSSPSLPSIENGPPLYHVHWEGSDLYKMASSATIVRFDPSTQTSAMLAVRNPGDFKRLQEKTIDTAIRIVERSDNNWYPLDGINTLSGLAKWLAVIGVQKCDSASSLAKVTLENRPRSRLHKPFFRSRPFTKATETTTTADSQEAPTSSSSTNSQPNAWVGGMNSNSSSMDINVNMTENTATFTPKDTTSR